MFMLNLRCENQESSNQVIPFILSLSCHFPGVYQIGEV